MFHSDGFRLTIKGSYGYNYYYLESLYEGPVKMSQIHRPSQIITFADSSQSTSPVASSMVIYNSSYATNQISIRHTGGSNTASADGSVHYYKKVAITSHGYNPVIAKKYWRALESY
ncbi:MAG: hypothetical protein L3J71_12570 [Victivallaceae bacterium]|nr:hypothetical protein [Victivallaceae bacterium]